jgi:hypothetical protein
MIWLLAGLRTSVEARALRFLLLCLCGWIAVRALATWNPLIPAVAEPPGAPWVSPSPFAVAMGRQPQALDDRAARGAPVSARRSRAQWPALPMMDRSGGNDEPASGGMGDGGFAADRHGLRLAMIARFFPRSGQSAGTVPARGGDWSSMTPAGAATPGNGERFWMQRQMAGWSLGGWLYVRGGSGRVPGGIAAGGQLGGSQGGLRLAYGFGDDGRVRAFARATIAVDQLRQREIAIGGTVAPIPRLPVDIAIEHRFAAGDQGRTALAAMVSGGVSDVALPGGFRLDGYAQAGVVGARRRDGFADGAIVVDRRLGEDERAPLRLGGLAAGAIQPGAARIDVGPRLTLRLPDVGKGSRIAVDWRQRVAGDARPESGLALTLAADF